MIISNNFQFIANHILAYNPPFQFTFLLNGNAKTGKLS